MKEVDKVSLISTTYGFLLGEELMHLQLCRSSDNSSSKGTYRLYPGPVFDTVKLDSNSTDMGEWVSTDLITVLHMYLQPADFKGDSWKRPAPNIGKAVPVSIHTYRNGNSVEKVYTPMIIPQLLGSWLTPSEALHQGEDEDYTAMSMLEIEVRLPNNRRLYLCMGDLVVGTIYYFLYLAKPTFYECIAQVSCSDQREVGDEYLLLSLNKQDVVMKLAG